MRNAIAQILDSDLYANVLSCRLSVEQLIICLETRSTERQIGKSLSYPMGVHDGEQKSKTEASEMPRWKGVRRCSKLNHTKNEDIREELHVILMWMRD